MLTSNVSKALEGKQWEAVWHVVERRWYREGQIHLPWLDSPSDVNLLHRLSQVICKVKMLMILTSHGFVYSK